MNIHTITHSNGQVSTRNSKASIFTHAVVVFYPEESNEFFVRNYASSLEGATKEYNRKVKYFNNNSFYKNVIVTIVEVQVSSQ